MPLFQYMTASRVLYGLSVGEQKKFATGFVYIGRKVWQVLLARTPFTNKRRGQIVK